MIIVLIGIRTPVATEQLQRMYLVDTAAVDIILLEMDTCGYGEGGTFSSGDWYAKDYSECTVIPSPTRTMPPCRTLRYAPRRFRCLFRAHATNAG